MARLHERLRRAQQALARLEELPLGMPDPDPVVRDAAIQRFELAFETAWKAVQAWLREAEGLAPASPKAVVRESARTGLIDQDEARALLRLVDDRNLTVHTYDEELARAIWQRLGTHARLLGRWLAAVTGRLDAAEGQPPPAEG